MTVGATRARSGPAMLTALGIDALGSGLYLPLSLIYFTLVSRIPLADVGFALSASNAVTLMVPLISGICADRFGPRRVVVVAQLLQAAGFCAYLAVHSLPTLLVATLVVGCGERTFWTTVYTLIAQSRSDGQLDTWYARVSVIRNLGLGAGTLLSGVALSIDSRPVYQGVVVANVLSFLVAAGLLGRFGADAVRSGPRERTAGGYRTILRDRPFLAFTATNVAYSLCLTIVTVAMSVYVVDGLQGSGWLVGVLFAVNTGLIIVAQSRVTRAVAAARRTRVLAGAGALWVVWALSLAAAPLLPRAALAPYLIAGIALFTLAEMMQSPTSTALAAAVGEGRIQGRYMAVYGYGYQLAKIIAPTLFAQLYGVRTALPWLVLAAIAAVAVPLLLRLEHVLPARALRPPSPAADGATA
ncbi:MAG: hypothetical protein V7637_2104 [Mycobacteriales bacterium]